MMSYESNDEYVENETTSSNTMLKIRKKLNRIESASVKSKRNKQITTLPDRNSPKREIMLNEMEGDRESLSQNKKHSSKFSDILSDVNTLYMYESFSESNLSSNSSTLDLTKSTVEVHSPYVYRDNKNATLNQSGRENVCVPDDLSVIKENKCENSHVVSYKNHLDRCNKINSKMCSHRSNTEQSIKESDSKQKKITSNPAINNIVRINTKKKKSNSIIMNDVTTCIKHQLSATLKSSDRGQIPDNPKHKTITRSGDLKHSATGKTYGMNTLAFNSQKITNNQSLNKSNYKDYGVMKNDVTRSKPEQIPCLDDVVLSKSSKFKSTNRNKKDKSKSGEFKYSNQYSKISNLVISKKDYIGSTAINRDKHRTQQSQQTTNGSYNYNSKHKFILKGDICTSGIDNTSIFTPVDGKEVDKRRPKLEDKSVQTSVNKLEYVQLPRLFNPPNFKNESTRLIRGQSKQKRISKEIRKELDERFERQVVASIQKSKRGKKKSEILNEDGSIFRSTRKKAKNKIVKTVRKRKIASPVTAMEIQKLMAFSTHKKLFQQEYIPVKTYEGESEDEAKEDIDIGHYSYIHACEQLGNPPIRKIFEQLQTHEISVQYVGLNTNDVIALAYGLLHNSRVESVDIEDNRMSEEGMLHVIELLNYNNFISSLSLSNNRMTVNCAGMLKEAISNNAWLTHLNLSGTKFGDDGAKHLGLAIRSNISIIWINLSHNDIGVTGAQHIGRALSINDTLEVLDLSWNHIRRMGALAICKGLQENSSIVNFNLSMNGFGIEGSLALENVFKENMSLKCIDLSNNRINWDGLVYLTRGLQKNNVLRILKLGDNPLPVDGIQNLLHAVSSHRSNLTHLSLENIPVNIKVMEEVHIIASKRLFTITHGGVLDSTDMFGIKRGREKREDPFTLLIRFIGMMGIRILDLFRIFESGAQSTVSKDNFIRGVKKVGAPLSDREIELVAKRLARKGQISYSILANGVRNHMREEKKEDKRQETIEVKKQEHRKNFLKSDLGEVKPPDVKELTMYKTVAGKNFARIMSSSNMLSSRKESPSPTSSRVSLLPRLVDKIVSINRSAKSILSQETHRLESAKRRKRQKIFSIV